jgi:AbrB family looped-hinge helix DNA binding protein
MRQCKDPSVRHLQQWITRTLSPVLEVGPGHTMGDGECLLAFYYSGFILTPMITTLSTKGQAVIPESIREQARLKAGDKLDVGYINGLVVLRKRVPMTPAQARALILSGRDLPALNLEDEIRVQETVAAVRKRRQSV